MPLAYTAAGMEPVQNLRFLQFVLPEIFESSSNCLLVIDVIGKCAGCADDSHKLCLRYSMSDAPSAARQNEPEEWMNSITSRIALTKRSTWSSLTINGGATFSTRKLLPHNCVRILCSRKILMTSIWPNMAEWMI